MIRLAGDLLGDLRPIGTVFPERPAELLELLVRPLARQRVGTILGHFGTAGEMRRQPTRYAAEAGRAAFRRAVWYF